MITVQVEPPYDAELDAWLLEDAATQTLEQQGTKPGAELTILVTDEAALHDLNLRFLGIDAPTDVLSFPAGETDPEGGSTYLGDVIIAYPRAQAQATAGRHPLEAELQLLAVHGVLHLLGHDHAADEDKARMWAAQREILTRLGAAAALPPD